jgi:hypothetical protein
MGIGGLPSVRPRFTVEKARILLAAMHLYAAQERSQDVYDLRDEVERMAESLEMKEQSCRKS